MRLPSRMEIGATLTAILLAGCTTLRPMTGYRVEFDPPTTNCSDDLTKLEKDSRELASAISWRAAYNRNAIYAGGLLLLGTTAATAGLGAAGAAGLSIALVGVSGGFVSGSLLLFHNADLANAYTTAEAKVNNAIAQVNDPLRPPSDSKTPAPAPGSDEDCRARYTRLLQAVTTAKNELERDRTNIATGASTTDIPAIKTQIAALAAALTPTKPVPPTATATQ
jgi:hypothetical protein